MIVGPTAVGKTALAHAIATERPVEILSADSRQVYRGMDVGTAKPSAAERKAVPYHGLDLIEPTERYSAGRFAREARAALAAIARRGRLSVVVGGTGLYLRALFEGLFAEPPLDAARRARLADCLRPLAGAELERWARRLDPLFAGGGSQRAARAIEIALLTGRSLSRLRAASPATGAPFTPWYARLTLERDKLAERIASRVDRMLVAGLVEEVERLLNAGVPRSAPGFSALGYPEVLAFLDGRLPRAALGPAIVRASRQYAKRQETWFRHQLRGPVGDYDAKLESETLARRVLADYGRD